MLQENIYEIENNKDKFSNNRIRKIGLYLSGIVFTSGTLLFGLGLINNFEHNTDKSNHILSDSNINTEKSNNGVELMTVGLIGMSAGLISGLVVNEVTE